MEYLDNVDYFRENNIAKVKIEGRQISIGENQSVYMDILNVSLLGPKDNKGEIDVFEYLENKNYEVVSGGYLTCAEVTGEFDINRKFFVHSLDPQRLRSHLLRIFSLAEGAKPEKIIVKLDKSRTDPKEYLNTLKGIIDKSTVIEIIDF